MPPIELAIIGPGRVGRSLARGAAGAGYAVSLHGREHDRGSLRRAAIVLICTPDREIEPVAAVLRDELGAKARVGHTSGVIPVATLGDAGAGRFGIHPLQTIPGPETPLAGVPCALSATDPETEAVAGRLARAIGMEPFPIEEEARAAYHAGAAIASNFLFALEESAAALLAAAGVPEPRSVLTKLVVSSAANWSEQGLGALTGPIARGDTGTVEAHRAAIAESAPELLDLYDVLAERTAELAGAGAAEPAGAVR